MSKQIKKVESKETNNNKVGLTVDGVENASVDSSITPDGGDLGDAEKDLGLEDTDDDQMDKPSGRHGRMFIMQDEFDRELSVAEGYQRKQMLVECMNLKVHTGDGDYPGGTVEGLANAFNNVDFQGEVVKPGAFKRTIKAFRSSRKGLPFMDNHRIFGGTDAIIGRVIELREEKAGLFFKAFFSSSPAAQVVRTKIHEKVLDSLSIGFNVVKRKVLKDGTMELLELKLREVSVVVFPANELATVSDVKQAISRIGVCEDLDREFDDALAAKRWATYCGSGRQMVTWDDVVWTKYIGGFAVVDMDAATREKSFRCPVVDVINNEPCLVYAGVVAAIEVVGKDDEFLKGLLLKFPSPKGSEDAEDEAQGEPVAPVSEGANSDVKAAVDTTAALKDLEYELQRAKQVRVARELRDEFTRAKNHFADGEQT